MVFEVILVATYYTFVFVFIYVTILHVDKMINLARWSYGTFFIVTLKVDVLDIG